MRRLRTSIVVGTVALLLGVLAVGTPAAPAAGSERATEVEPLWHVAAAPDAHFVAADARGSVATGSRGGIVVTDPIGRSMWSGAVTTADERVLLPPTASASSIYVPIEHSRIAALDRSTGRKRWEEPIADVVAVGSSATGDVVAVVTRTRVELRDGSSGGLRWGFDQPIDRAIPEILAAPLRVAVRAKAVVVAWEDSSSHLVVLDRVDGRLLWERGRQKATSAPVVSEDAVYVAENRRLTDRRDDVVSMILRLDLGTGAVEWRRRVRGIFLPGFVGDVEGGTVVVVDLRGRVFALDATTGRVRWRRATGAEQYANETHIVGGVVALTTLGTGLVVLDRRDGSPVPNESPGRAQPFSIIRGSAATGDQLYLLTHPNGGSGEQDAVLIMLPTGPDGYAPGLDLGPRPDG